MRRVFASGQLRYSIRYGRLSPSIQNREFVMQPTTRNWLLTGAAVIALLTGCGQQQNPPPAAPLDPEAEAQLGAECEADGHLIRPPKGYNTVAPPPGPPGATMMAWEGPRRTDGVAHVVTVMVGSPPPNERLPDLEEFSGMMLNGVRLRRAGWNQAPAER